MGKAESSLNFLDFAASHGLIIDALREGRWVRVKTTDKPKKRNGSYKFLGDVGFVQNHATMEQVAVWKDGVRAGFIDKAGMRARAALAAAAEKAKHDEARAKAQQLIDRATYSTHPYFARKGLQKEMMIVHDGKIVVPMRDFLTDKLNSAQIISEDGEKKFLPGGKAKGSVFKIGPAMARERWLVEGYATGLSVYAALEYLYRDACVVVCFSAGNLAYVGKLAKELRPKAYVFADNDKSKAGEQAAEETGLPWLMAPEEGMDANDYHQKHGIKGLAKLIRSEWRQNTVREMRSMKTGAA